MAKVFICQDSKCNSDHAYCYTCYKEVCEKGEADVHRSIGHEVQPRGKLTSRLEGNSFNDPPFRRRSRPSETVPQRFPTFIG